MFISSSRMKPLLIFIGLFIIWVHTVSAVSAANPIGWVYLRPTDESINEKYDIRGIFGLSKSEVYAVGSNSVGPIIARYDGDRIAEMFSTFSPMVEFYDIWAGSSSDIFVIGWNENESKPIIRHYDGAKWEDLTITLPANNGVVWGAFRGIWGDAPDNVYACGWGHLITSSGDEYFHILHYDGNTWSPLMLPAIAAALMDSPFHDIWGFGNKIFAVGAYRNKTDSIVLKSDNGTWSYETIQEVEFWSVHGTSDNDIFAVGQETEIYHYGQPEIHHYDGAAWSNMNVPPDPANRDPESLEGVWALKSNIAYAVGIDTIMKYDGSSWTYMSWEQIEGGGRCVWGANEDHVFIGTNYTIMETGEKLTSTTGKILTVAVGDTTFEQIVPFDPANVPDDGKPENLPYGLFDFTVPVPEGAKATISFNLREPLSADEYDWWKYSQDKGWYVHPNAEFLTVTDLGITVVTLEITDNGDGDEDPRPGWISDPSGPGNPGTDSGGGGGGGGGGGCFIHVCHID